MVLFRSLYPFLLSVAIECEMLPSIKNGKVSFPNGNTRLGAAALYECVLGYQLSGDRERICLSSGEWSGREPQCTSEWLRGSNMLIVIHTDGANTFLVESINMTLFHIDKSFNHGT